MQLTAASAALILAATANAAGFTSEVCQQDAANVATYKKSFTYATDFATYYLHNRRSRVPLDGFTVAQFTQTSICVLQEAGDPVPSPLPNPTGKPKPQTFTCDREVAAVIDQDFAEPLAFCKFYHAYPRDNSPVPGFEAIDLQQGCQCILDAPTTTSAKPPPTTIKTTTKTTTKAPTTTKTTTKAPTTTKPTTKPTTTVVPPTTKPTSTVAPPSTTTTTTNPGDPGATCTSGPATVTTVAINTAEEPISAGFTEIDHGYGSTLSGNNLITQTHFPASLAASVVASDCASVAVGQEGPSTTSVQYNIYLEETDSEVQYQWQCVVLGTNTEVAPMWVQAPQGDIACSYAYAQTEYELGPD